MTAPHSLIRRDAALDALARVGILPDDAAMDTIRALPADPVGEAAGKLAEATEAHETEARVMDHDMDAWRAAPVYRKHELGLVADNSIELKARAERAYHAALYAYRAAVAARDAGEKR